jgi:hypothetical protein
MTGQGFFWEPTTPVTLTMREEKEKGERSIPGLWKAEHAVERALKILQSGIKIAMS